MHCCCGGLLSTVGTHPYDLQTQSEAGNNVAEDPYAYYEKDAKNEGAQ